MKVKIRLARWGSKRNNFFGLVAAPVKFARDGKHLDRLGTYNPHPYFELSGTTKVATKHLELNIDRIKYWLSVGAQPTHRVAWLLAKAGIMPPLPKQLHNQGLTSLTDKTTWNVKVTDQSGLILGVIPGHEARVIFTTDDYVPKGIPVPEKVKVSFKDAQKIKISNEFATVDHAKQISMLKAMMTGKGDHGEAI